MAATVLLLALKNITSPHSKSAVLVVGYWYSGVRCVLLRQSGSETVDLLQSTNQPLPLQQTWNEDL